MVLRKLVGLFACALIVGIASFATAGIPDLFESTADAASGNTVVSVFNLPNGQGAAFTEALDGTGMVDATINLILLDGNTDPVANFSREDLWLESADGGMIPCMQGSIARFNTNVDGETEWSLPLGAGGYSEDLCQVVVNGDALTSSAGMPIHFNSADLTGDGAVSLADVAVFSGDFYSGDHPYRSDFTYDGVVTLADVGKLAGGLGATCN